MFCLGQPKSIKKTLSKPIHSKLRTISRTIQGLAQKFKDSSRKNGIQQQQQQCIVFKIYKAYNTLYPTNSYTANLGRTTIINKGVILHIKKKRKRKEMQVQHTERKTPHTNSSTGVLLLEKKTKITTGGIYNLSGKLLKYSIK